MGSRHRVHREGAADISGQRSGERLRWRWWRGGGGGRLRLKLSRPTANLLRYKVKAGPGSRVGFHALCGKAGVGWRGSGGPQLQQRMPGVPGAVGVQPGGQAGIHFPHDYAHSIHVRSAAGLLMCEHLRSDIVRGPLVEATHVGLMGLQGRAAVQGWRQGERRL